MKSNHSLHKGIPILLTSSVIAHDTQVKLLDPSLRLQHTIESIKKWIEITPESPIVVCDGSGYDFSALLTEKFPDHPIEFLSFNNDEALVKEFGRGYGEGEIVKYAINNSRVINRLGCFAKCTAKLWVENYSECLKYWNKIFICKGVFKNTLSPFKKTEMHYIDTRFYICDLNFYKSTFIDCHRKIEKKIGRGLEECFQEESINSKISRFIMPIYPIINGIGGGTATHYQTKKIRKIKEDIKIFFAKRNKSLTSLFAF